MHLMINTLIRNTVVLPAYHNVGEWWGPYDRPERRFEHIDRFCADWATLGRTGSIIKTHATRPLFEARYRRAKVIYVYRDPRDTMVSFFRYLNHENFRKCNPQASDQHCASLRDFLRRPINDYLRMGYALDEPRDTVVDRWAAHVQGWQDHPMVLCLRFEQIVTNFALVVDQAARFLGLRKRWRQTPVAVRDMFSILPGEGRIGAWRDHLVADDVAFIRHRSEAIGLRWEQVIWEPSDARVNVFAA
jgi:hypothetical protein